MKKLILITVLLLSGYVLQTAVAQTRVNDNIGVQPQWGPDGYDHVGYYYLPDIDVFYNVPKRQYIYEQQGRWVFTKTLPSQFIDFDLYSSYKVVVNDRNPYKNAQMYRTKYAVYKGNRDQKIIRNSRDSRYFANKEHPKHNQWKMENERLSKDNKKRH